MVASRLSEINNWTVLLLEAGGHENVISDVPALSSYTQMTDFDWMYQTAPPTDSPYCLAMIGDRCNWPRGKVRIQIQSFRSFATILRIYVIQYIRQLLLMFLSVLNVLQ